MSAEPIRVILVDDHPVFRMGMAGLLASLDGITVVGQASDAAEALALPLDEIDVVLMDLNLGADSGIETTREIVRRDPDARVLVVTMREDDDAVAAATAAALGGEVVVEAVGEPGVGLEPGRGPHEDLLLEEEALGAGDDRVLVLGQRVGRVPDLLHLVVNASGL